MPKMMRINILLLLLSSTCFGVASADEPTIAPVLEAQFETVLYSRSDLLSKSHEADGITNQKPANLLLPFVFLQVALNSTRTTAFSDLMGSSEGVFVGARDFRAPEGIGPVYSVRCYVVVLRHTNRFEFGKYMGVSSASATDKGEWRWSAKLGEFGERAPKLSSLYGIQVGRRYVLVSNDPASVRIVAQQLASTKKDTVTPAESADCDIVAKHAIWGCRRYREPKTEDRMAAGMQNIPKDAKTIAFFVDSEEELVTVRLFGDLSPGEDTDSQLDLGSGLSHLKRAGNAWELTFPLSGDQKAFDRTFIVAGLFGFAVYL
jgi:hypothetical protein